MDMSADVGQTLSLDTFSKFSFFGYSTETDKNQIMV